MMSFLKFSILFLKNSILKYASSIITQINPIY